MIITSFLFPSGKFSQEHLGSVLASLDGDKEKLVIDLSCRKKEDTWFVAMNKWQVITDMEVNEGEQALERMKRISTNTSDSIDQVIRAVLF